MTTDITELAQREKFEAWARSQKLSLSYGDCGYVFSSTEMAWLAWMASSSELVEALEKPHAENTAGVAGMAESYETTISMLRSRIAELESRTVIVKLPKPHAHLIWIQAGHAPDDYWDDVAVSHSEKDRCCDGSERYPVYARWEIEEMLTAAGIKWEAE